MPEDAQINIHVTEEVRHKFKQACLSMHTTMSAVLRDAVTETITIASLLPAGGGLAQKGNGDG